jgi:thiosulfate/3-mercaptopyruvate sulfurtransferase
MYCGSGVTACHNLLAMEHAGLSGARLYVGSWSEWSADPARAVETGPVNGPA